MADTDVTRIAGNIGAMNALYALNNINKQLSIHQTRLATGKRINSAADDPAGLAISTKMLSRSLSLKTALSNIGDAKNLLAVAESGLGRLTDILNSMRTITENAANDTNGTEERTIVKEQLASYAQQINDIVAQTKWSDKLLIDGSYSTGTGTLTFQTGADVGETTTLTGLIDMKAEALKLLKTAASAVDASVTAADDDFGTGWTVAATNTLATGVTQATAGTYSVSATFDASGNFTLNLLDAAGSSVLSTTGAYVGGEEETINFGNGIIVTMSSGGIYTAGDPSEVSITADDMTVATSTFVAGCEAISGDYTVTATFGADGAYTATMVQGTYSFSATGDFDDDRIMDFGNGVTVTIDPALDAADREEGDAITGTVTYTASTPGTYTLEDSEDFAYTEFSEAVTAGTVNIGELEDSAAFSAYMTIIDKAMVSVNSMLSKIGSLTGSLTFKEDQISSSQINVEASYNRIMNANMAEEQVNASKLLILQQTSTAMLAQANAAPQFLLSLFQ